MKGVYSTGSFYPTISKYGAGFSKTQSISKFKLDLVTVGTDLKSGYGAISDSHSLTGKATASKVFKLTTAFGSSLSGSEAQQVYLFNSVSGKLEVKKLSDVLTTDYLIQPYGYFSKYVDDSFFNTIGDSPAYLSGLWFGRGAKYFRGAYIIRLDSTKDFDICKLLKRSKLITTSQQDKNFINFTMTQASKITFDSMSFKSAVQFVKGIIDGCGFIYFAEDHSSDLGIRFQEKDRELAEFVLTVFQSLGIVGYIANTFKSKLFNGNLNCFDLRIRGYNSTANFIKFFGFTNTFKNNLLMNYYSQLDYVDVVPACVGVAIGKCSPELLQDAGNKDSELIDFLHGDSVLARDNMSMVCDSSHPIVDLIRSGALLARVVSSDVEVGVTHGVSVSASNNGFYIVGSSVVC